MAAGARLLLLVALLGCGWLCAGAGEAGARAPAFLPGGQRVLGAAGKAATLTCRVLHLGDKAVSWVRSRDLQILTHGGVVFTADARVSAPAPAPPPPRSRAAPAPQSFALRIERLRLADAGRYECQLNTEPKMSQFFDLTVADEAEAKSTEELFSTEEPSVGAVRVWAVERRVRARGGDAAELACAARVDAGESPPAGAAPPLDIHWLHDGKPLTLQEGCEVSRRAGAQFAESRLRLARVRGADAGEYTCAAGARAATLTLEVSEQESFEDMEAMQRDGVTAPGGDAARPLRARAAAAAAALALLIRHM